MNCPSCAHANRPGAKFCEECAAPLPRACASCGAELRASAKFCDECGTPVAAKAARGAVGASGQRASEARSEAQSAKPSQDQRGSRKIVTIIFADLVGSTALHERLDPESVRRFMESYYAAMRGAVDAHGGRVTQVMGDGVKAVFGAPRVAEDDALRAVRAGVEMQNAFRELAQRESALVGPTGLRVAVNTGEVVADDASEIIGDPVNVAARLQEKGAIGDVVVGGETQRIVAAHVTLALLGSFALKGRSEPVKAYRVESLDPPARETTAAFVGRDDELARLTSVYEAACAKPATQLAVLLGSPGLGKSRLIEELARRLGDAATVMSAHCDAAGGATFAPLARALREGLGIDESASGDGLRNALAALLPGDDAESPRVARGISALLSGSPASPEESFFVVRRLLATLAAAKPVLLVIDDLHWAEPLLLDLVEHLVQWGSGTKLLVLVGARPELREARSSLVTPGGLVADVITLAGLDAFAATRLAANVIGAADLPTAIAAKLLTTSEGNPLFVGALVRMLVDEGALRREGERWVASAELAQLEMPPTIQALLAARIERLRPEERVVLERAAVVGRHFSRSAVAALLGPRDAAELGARLESLQRAELIERDTGWWLGEPALRFHHVLIRDAAYRRVLKGTRAELHARLADWIEARTGESIEHDETIGWHLEQAHEHLRELGPLDARAIALGTRAAQRLAAAGRRALARDDLALAGSLLQRALERLDPGDASRADLALDCSEALLASGDVAPAAAVIEELGRLASDTRLRAWHTCFAAQLTALTEPSALNAAAERVAAAADALAKLGDAAGEAKAHHVHAQALARLGRVGAAEAALDRALAAARRAGDRRRANAVLAGAPLAALWGPSPVTRASGRCLDVVRVLRITQDAPAVEAVALSCQGVLEALRGRTEAARRMVASARKMVEELGVTQRVLEVDVIAARIDALEGDAAAAERLLRNAADGLRALGLGNDAASALAQLGRALLAQGGAAEAEALSHESEALAGDDLQAAIAWRVVRAEALAQRGEHAAALVLAQAAVEIASATDALLDHADARLSLATVLRAAGRCNEASAEEKRAIELWEAKGATLLVERTRRETSPPAPIAGAHEARAESAQIVRRRVRANSALRCAERHHAGVVARDVEALMRPLSAEIEVVHHPTGTAYGGPGVAASWRSIFEGRESAARMEPVATLGERVALVRMGLSTARDVEFGSIEAETLLLVVVDAHGLAIGFEFFKVERLGDAIARLYARYAEQLPPGAERTRAEAVARSVAASLRHSNEPAELARYRPVLATEFELADHRLLGTWAARTPDEHVQNLASWQGVTTGAVFHTGDVLALEPGGLLLARTLSGAASASGGAFERPFLVLFAFDRDGFVAREEYFDVGDEARAFARFDELTARGEPQQLEHFFANAASRAVDAFDRCFNARDWPRVEALHAPEVVFDDRRRMLRNTTGKQGALATLRFLFDVPSSRFSSALIATRGERLALHRMAFEGEVAGGGPLAVDPSLALREVDRDGRIVAVVLFEETDEAAAYAELDARFAAGEGAAHAATLAFSLAFVRAFESREWDVLSSLLTPAFMYWDHRLLGFGESRDSGTALAVTLLRALAELAPDVTARIEHLRLSERGVLNHVTHFGSRDGGEFERTFLSVFELDVQGRVLRGENFDVQQFEQARARFAEIAARSSAPLGADPFANAASRADDELMRCFNGRDWAGVLACVAPEVVFDERRRFSRNTADREIWLGQFRFLFDVPESRFTIRLLATRGERLSLHRHEFEGVVAGGGGPLEIEPHLTLHEVDRDGRIVAIVVFDLVDEAAAYAELDARFEAGEGAAHDPFLASFSAIATRDWAAVAAFCGRAFIEQDHRRLAVFGTTRGPEAWVGALRSIVDLAPDARLRLDHLRASGRGKFFEAKWLGTRDGGAFEIPIVGVNELDEQGKQIRFDLYDPENLDQARARFEEIVARTAPARFENAAARAQRRTMAAWRAHDWDAFARTFAPEFHQSDRRKLVLLELDREQTVAFTRQVGDMRATRVAAELFATRGDRLSLSRLRVEVAEGAVGPSQIVSLTLNETNDRDESIALIRFDDDDLAAAYAELDARFEAGEGAAHPHITSVFARAAAEDEWAEVVALCAAGFVEQDHRPLAVLGTTRGAEAWVANFRSLLAVAPGSAFVFEHVRCAARAMLFQCAWNRPAESGAYEIPLISVGELDATGKLARIDIYEHEQLAAARARFDEIAARTASAADASLSRFENAASRAWRTAMAAWVARDVARWEQHHHAFVRYRDHRRLMQLDYNREQLLEFTRPLLEMRSASASLELLATRGERLALMRLTLEVANDAAGASVIESLILIETNAAGAVVETQRWDMDDLDAAYAELDARFEASERAWMPAFCRALARRDWDAVSALCADGLIAEDHRMVGWGSLQGPAADMMTLRSMVELAPDARIRLDHLRTSERSELFESKWLGTRDGGAFEIPNVGVTELDEQGRQIRLDLYDPEKLDRARALFDELAARSAARDPLRIPPNAASEWLQRFRRVFNARDWEAARALYAADATYEDRQRFSRLSGGLDLMLSSLRERANAGAMLERIELLGTAGDRVAVERVLWAGGSGVTRFEMEFLCVQVVDEHGRLSANVNFDLGDARAARREAWARWAAIEPELAAPIAQSGEGFDAWSERDPARLRAALADDLVVEDHRREGMGRIEGADAYVASVSELYELSPDSRVELVTWLAVGSHGSLTIARRGGSVFNEGGAYESAYLLLCLFTSGPTTRMEMFELEERDAALARFEELGRDSQSSTRDPLRIPPNVATRALDRWYAGTASGDMEAVRALYVESYFLEDRRALMKGRFDLEAAVANARFLSEGWRWKRTLLATAGDCLALWRILFTTGEAGAASEVEILEVDEVDREGRIVRLVLFDPDARAAASAELFESYVRLGADGMRASQIEGLRAIAAHYPARLRAALPDSYFVEDHRRLGLGRLERDAYVASLTALNDLSREVRIDELYQVAVAPSVRLAVTRMAGLNAEGGEFETVVVLLHHYENGQLASNEVFDLEALDAALARFEELGRSAQSSARDPLQIPPNAAARATDRQWALWSAGDWDGLASLLAGIVYEDRRRMIRLSGGTDLLLADLRHLAEAGFAPRRRLLATAGERIAIEHMLWTQRASGAASEIEVLRVTEVDSTGRIVAVAILDAEDREAAFEEAEARFAAGEAAEIGLRAPLIAMSHAMAQQDWPALRESLSPSFEMHDLRTLGHGVLARDAWVESNRTLIGLGSGVHIEHLRLLAWNRHGRASVVRTAGLNESGGEFEILAIGVLITEGDRVARMEHYDLADAERALARFEALCAEREKQRA